MGVWVLALMVVGRVSVGFCVSEKRLGYRYWMWEGLRDWRYQESMS